MGITRNQVILIISLIGILLVVFYDTLVRINFKQVFLFIGIIGISYKVITQIQSNRDSDYNEDEDEIDNQEIQAVFNWRKYSDQDSEIEIIDDDNYNPDTKYTLPSQLSELGNKAKESLQFRINNLIDSKNESKNKIFKVGSREVNDLNCSDGMEVVIGELNKTSMSPNTTSKADYGLLYKSIEADLIEIILGKQVLIKRYNHQSKNNSTERCSIELKLISEDGIVSVFKINSDTIHIINKSGKNFNLDANKINTIKRELDFSK